MTGTEVDRLKSYLSERRLKQWELAALIGAPAQTVNRWLRGKAMISNAYMKVLESKRIL